jgi:RimJ/RimL family protein N-acetyltransferase
MFRPLLHTFDSGKVADRVASLILGEDETVSDAEIAELLEAASAESFDLFWIQTRTPLDSPLLEHRGTLVELEGSRDAILSRCRLAPPRHGIRALASDADWDLVEQLLRFSAPTRFSTDRNITEATVRRHKLSLLKGHVENRHGVVALSYPIENPAQSVGYHSTSLEDDHVLLYEIAVDPAFRRGAAAINLVRYNLERLAESYPGAERVVTRIYEDNIASLQLFARLDMTPTGRLFHYYHCWPKERR